MALSTRGRLSWSKVCSTRELRSALDTDKQGLAGWRTNLDAVGEASGRRRSELSGSPDKRYTRAAMNRARLEKPQAQEDRTKRATVLVMGFRLRSERAAALEAPSHFIGGRERAGRTGLGRTVRSGHSASWLQRPVLSDEARR
jgi:hypothetical protein